MKKILVVLIAVALVIAVSCNQKKEESCAKPMNPNGDSELALLMREMTAHLESEHKLLAAGKAPSAKPEGYERITTATPSDSKQLNEQHNGFAKIYLEALSTYHSSTPENYKFAYNNLVKSCISCHENECPGPIKRIEKLLFKE